MIGHVSLLYFDTCLYLKFSLIDFLSLKWLQSNKGKIMRANLFVSAPTRQQGMEYSSQGQAHHKILWRGEVTEKRIPFIREAWVIG